MIVSPRTTAASSTVNSGSTVDSVDACVGPMRARPAKNSVIAATVETSAMPATASQPAVVPGQRGPDSAAANANSSAALPMTSVAIGSAATPRPTRAPTRM